MPEYNISDTFRLEKNYDPNYDNWSCYQSFTIPSFLTSF
jgi:hypothetical protein